MTLTRHLERKHYVDGGGTPFYSMSVTGRSTIHALLSQHIPLNGSPDGIDILSYGPNKLLMSRQLLRRLSLGRIRCRCAPNLPQPSDSVALHDRAWHADRFHHMDYLRDTSDITYFLDHGGCAIYDPLMFRWVGAIRMERSRSLHLLRRVPGNHTVILYSEETDPSLKWFHTRGMPEIREA